MCCVLCASADSAVEAGAPVEITPAMIDAGAIELASFAWNYDDIDDKAARIFRAMFAAKPKNAEL
jgi:hypothetical protein